MTDVTKPIEPFATGDSARTITAGGHPSRGKALRRRLAPFIVASLVVLAACGRGTDEFVARAGDLGHIHDLAIDENGMLLAASHTGLYKIEDESRAVLVGVPHDLMSMTLLPDGDLLASGHPNLLLEEFRVENRPPFLGLARSTDGGRSWDELDLLGEADFHALVPTDDGLYAAETTGSIWFRDPDTGWTILGHVDAQDLAIDPDNSLRQLATDYDAKVWASIDGGITWAEMTDAPALLEIEWFAPDVVLGATQSGTILTTNGPLEIWTAVAAGPTDVETFHVDATGAWWVSVHGGEISRSDDQGASWTVAYSPPEYG